MNILFASGHLPSSQGLQAGAKVSFYVAKFFAQRHSVNLLFFATLPELNTLNMDDMAVFSSWDMLAINNRDRARGIASSPRLPISIGVRQSSRFQNRFRSLLANQSIDVVLFDHTAMFAYRSSVPNSVVSVGLAHDILSQSWRRKTEYAKGRIKHSLYAFETQRISQWEAKTFADLDRLLVLNDKDEQLARELNSDAHIQKIEPWFSPALPTRPVSKEKNTLLFWGAMNRRENIDAVDWTVEAILPIIRKEVPEAILCVAGNGSELLKQKFSGQEGIRIVGFVEDIPSMMASMDIALLPLRLGAGIKIKTLECLSAGIPVVTTPTGAEGVGGVAGVHYLVGNSAAEIASYAISLLKNPEMASRIGQSGQELMAGRPGFEAPLLELEKNLECLSQKRKRP